MNTAILPSVLILAFILVYFFVVNPAIEEKQSAAKDAAKISKYFGDTEITLFRFTDRTEQYGECGTYVFVEFNFRFDNEYDLCSHRKHYEIGYWTEKGANKRKDAEKHIEAIKLFLPYSFRTVDAPISYQAYKEVVHMIDGSSLMNRFI